VNVTLLSIGSFKELEMTFAARFLVAFEWFDSRIEFFNLNKGKGVNWSKRECPICESPKILEPIGSK
jgi:hypothetical protein